MRRIYARCEGDRQGCYPVFACDGAPNVRISVPHPLDCSYLRGGRRQSGYSRVEMPEPGTYVARLEWRDRGIDFSGRLLAHRPFGWQFFQNVFVLPNVISTTAVALLWYFVFQVDIGLLNHVLTSLGLTLWTRPWLCDPHAALFATQAPFVLYMGFTMIIFRTQISTIPADTYEAARIDGASAWQLDWYITIPLVRRAVAITP